MVPKKPFRFQQFTIRDDCAAMKIGTDAVLLGAGTQLRGAQRILDVGTGCGIVALMIAQRSQSLGSTIAAIDIDQSAAAQAVENFHQSPWPDRLPDSVDKVHQPLQTLATQDSPPRFDLITCNPPFFRPLAQIENSPRQIARATKTLDRRQLFRDSKSLLVAEGRLSIIIPFEQAATTIKEASSFGFTIVARTDVRPTPDSSLKRSLLEFGLAAGVDQPLSHDELIVENSRHVYSDDYRQLTQDFHLRYA